MAERQPGSDRGHTTVDWEAAFASYASLPDPDRSYQAVATQFGVSVRTVEKHGRDDRWKQRLQEVKREAAVALNAQLAGRQMESLQGALKLAEATYTRYAQQLQAGTVRVTPSDLARMVALQTQITDTITTLTTSQANESEEAGEQDLAVEEGRQLQVLRALQSTGALDRVLALLDDANPEEKQ